MPELNRDSSIYTATSRNSIARTRPRDSDQHVRYLRIRIGVKK